jgi:hypothetical protein
MEPNYGAGNQLGKKRDKQGVMTQRNWFGFHPVGVNQVSYLVKSKKRDSQGQEDGFLVQGKGKKMVQIINEKIKILKIAKG